MGIIGSLKKLLFASKSVAKSGAEKAGDAAVEKFDDIKEGAEDLLTNTGKILQDKTSGLRDAVADSSEDLLGKLGDIKEKATDYMDNLDLDSHVDQLKEKINDVKDTVSDKLEDLGNTAPVQKAAEVSENVGDKVLDAGEAFMGSAKTASEKLGDKLGDLKESLAEKANEGIDKLQDKYNETLAKAEAEKAREALEPKEKYSSDDLDTGGSLLEGTDDFFSKASKYADGDYGAMSEGKIELLDERGEVSKNPVKAAGFEDLDGDGDEIIDDAIIEE